MSDKTYVGKGWAKTFDNGGSIINLSIKKSDIIALQEDQYGNVYLVVGQRREPDAKSKATHWVAVDDFRQGKLEAEDEGF